MKYIKYVLIIIVLIIIANGFYVLDETKQAIVTQFGKPVGNVINEAGLKFKIPFIRKVHFFEKRVLEWDGDKNQIPTNDKKYLWFDIFARWEISNPLKFYESTRTETYAHSRLDDIIDGTTRDIVSSYRLIELVKNTNRDIQYSSETGDELKKEAVKISFGREKIQNEIFKSAQKDMKKYGMRLVDVKIKRLNYIDNVRSKVYDRMISERNKIASKYRSEGRGKAAEISGDMKKELNEIESEAYKKAQIIKAEGDAEATEIYAKAYSKDADFYEFLQTLTTYKQIISNKNTMILSTDSDLFKYLKDIDGK